LAPGYRKLRITQVENRSLSLSSLVAFFLADPCNFLTDRIIDAFVHLWSVAGAIEEFKMDKEWRKNDS